MSSEQVIGWVFSRVKLIDLDYIWVGYGEQMASITKSDLPAPFNVDFFEYREILFENIHDQNFVAQGKHKVQAWRVKSHCK